MKQTIYIEYHEGWDTIESRQELAEAVWVCLSKMKDVNIDVSNRHQGVIAGEVDSAIDWDDMFDALGDALVMDVTREYGDVGLTLEPIL